MGTSVSVLPLMYVVINFTFTGAQKPAIFTTGGEGGAFVGVGPSKWYHRSIISAMWIVANGGSAEGRRTWRRGSRAWSTASFRLSTC